MVIYADDKEKLQCSWATATMLFTFAHGGAFELGNSPCFECFDNEFVYDSSFGIYKFFDCPYNHSFPLE